MKSGKKLTGVTSDRQATGWGSRPRRRNRKLRRTRGRRTRRRRRMTTMGWKRRRRRRRRRQRRRKATVAAAALLRQSRSPSCRYELEHSSLLPAQTRSQLPSVLFWHCLGDERRTDPGGRSECACWGGRRRSRTDTVHTAARVTSTPGSSRKSLLVELWTDTFGNHRFSHVLSCFYSRRSRLHQVKLFCPKLLLTPSNRRPRLVSFLRSEACIF